MNPLKDRQLNGCLFFITVTNVTEKVINVILKSVGKCHIIVSEPITRGVILMLVHFYEVRNCTFESYKGDPVLFAPADADDDTLMKHGFRRNKEERWYRPVNMAEYNYIVYCAQYGDVSINEETARYIVNYNPPVTYQQQQRDNYNANVLCYISVGLMALGFPMTFLATILVGGLFFIAAMVLMIIVRVKYPQNQFGRVLCIVYIVLAIIAVVLTIAAMIILAIVCNQIMQDCESCCHGIPG